LNEPLEPSNECFLPAPPLTHKGEGPGEDPPSTH